MIVVRRIKQNAPVVLFYSLTERDRAVSEYLGANISHYSVRYGGAIYGRGYFKLEVDRLVFDPPKPLRNIAEFCAIAQLYQCHFSLETVSSGSSADRGVRAQIARTRSAPISWRQSLSGTARITAFRTGFFTRSFLRKSGAWLAFPFRWTARAGRIAALRTGCFIKNELSRARSFLRKTGSWLAYPFRRAVGAASIAALRARLSISFKLKRARSFSQKMGARLPDPFKLEYRRFSAWITALQVRSSPEKVANKLRSFTRKVGDLLTYPFSILRRGTEAVAERVLGWGSRHLPAPFRRRLYAAHVFITETASRIAFYLLWVWLLACRALRAVRRAAIWVWLLPRRVLRAIFYQGRMMRASGWRLLRKSVQMIAAMLLWVVWLVCRPWHVILKLSNARVAYRRLLAASQKSKLTAFLLQPILKSKVVGVFINYYEWRRQALLLLKNAKADVVVLFEENAEGLTRIMAGVAWKKHIPYIIIPQTIPNPKEPAQYYRSSPEHDGDRIIARAATLLAPQWRYPLDGRAMIRLPLSHIVSLHCLALAPKEPWILNSGYADAVCIECDAIYDQYKALGFPDEQLVVCGHPVDDTLYSTHMNRAARLRDLENALGMVPGRPLVVVGFPPDQFTSPDVFAFEHRNFEQMCEAWREGLDCFRDRANVVIRPHPRLRADRLKGLADVGNIVSDMPTEALIPLADLYVACISATIRWALGLGIPVINYDCYRYRYGDYDNAGGCTTVEDQKAFIRALQSALAEQTLAQSAKRTAEAERARWGVIDGRFVHRFEAALDRAVATKGISYRAVEGMDIERSHQEIKA